MEISIYRLLYDGEQDKMVCREDPMFRHTMKDEEVFVLSYTLRQDIPMIMLKFKVGDQVAEWMPMRDESGGLILPEELILP